MGTFSIAPLPSPPTTSLFPSSLPITKLYPQLLMRGHYHHYSFRLVTKFANFTHQPDQHKQEEEEDYWIDVEFGKLVEEEKCRERKGVVELLECLETEAIMGDDQGKNPTDYNRRAQIFDTSSRVFQALKEHDTTTTPPHSQH